MENKKKHKIKARFKFSKADNATLLKKKKKTLMLTTNYANTVVVKTSVFSCQSKQRTELTLCPSSSSLFKLTSGCAAAPKYTYVTASSHQLDPLPPFFFFCPL